MRFLVLVAMLALAGCAAAPSPEVVVPSAAAVPSTTSAAPVIPDSALLEVGDLPGAGWRVVERSQGATRIPEWAGWLSNCRGHRAHFETRDRRLDARSMVYTVWPRVGRDIVQTLEIFPTGMGEHAMADLGSLVDRCTEYEFAGRDDPPFRERATVLPLDGLFVLLVREAAGGVTTTRHVAVTRHGDVTVTVEMIGLSEAEARIVARRAATRLGRA